MKFIHIDEHYQTEWEDVVASNLASGFMQSFFWTKFTNLLSWPTYKIGILNDNDRLIGGAVVTKFEENGHNYLYIPEGPVLPYGSDQADQLFEGLVAEIDQITDLRGEKRTSHVRIDPRLTTVPDYFQRFQKAPINVEPLRSLVIDLSLSKDQILSQMKPKGRYNIKVSQRYGLHGESTDIATGLSDFLTFYRQTVDRRNFEGKEDSYFVHLMDAIDTPHRARMFFVRDGEEILAAAFVIFYGKVATFLFGASSDHSREKMAPYLLHWEIINQAKELGFKSYDFYGINPEEQNPDHPWQGFTTFKEKFGGKQVKYIGAYDFVYNQKLYHEYLKTSGETN